MDSIVHELLPIATRCLEMLPNNATFMLIFVMVKWMNKNWCIYISKTHRPGDLCYHELTLTVNFPTLIRLWCSQSPVFHRSSLFNPSIYRDIMFLFDLPTARRRTILFIRKFVFILIKMVFMSLDVLCRS